MSDASKPFDFSQFVPGFDFLKNLSGAGAAAPGAPGIANWIAPTLSVEEVDKRIQELKTVQFWLEQNAHALKATIQALEVQKMTLSTLRGMNVQMEDLASAFARQAQAAPTPVTEPAPKEAEKTRKTQKADAPAAAPDAEKSAADPLQWWGALTQQFQQIAASALRDVSQLKMPGSAPGAGEAKASAAGRSGAKTAVRRSAAKGPSVAKPAAVARKRTG
jgi:hypothetical protein